MTRVHVVMQMKVLIDVAYILMPALISYAVQSLCPLGPSVGQNVKFRPPPWVFGVVWPVLYLLLGYSWSREMRLSRNTALSATLYISTALALAGWIYVYGCRQEVAGASWVLLLSIATTLACFGQGDSVSRLCLSPLLAWLIFALHMNTAAAQQLDQAPG